MYDHTFYKQVQISRSDIRPHIKWAVSLVILHMVTSIFLRALCGYIWVNILTLSPRGVLIFEYSDHHQNLISSSLYNPGYFHKISSHSVYNFLSNVLHKQTKKQRDKQANQRYQKHRPPSEGFDKEVNEQKHKSKYNRLHFFFFF